MHREVAEKSAQLRAKKRAQEDSFRKRTPNFQAGDYVLVGIQEPNLAGKKLYLNGEARIVLQILKIIMILKLKI